MARRLGAAHWRKEDVYEANSTGCHLTMHSITRPQSFQHSLTYILKEPVATSWEQSIDIGCIGVQMIGQILIFHMEQMLNQHSSSSFNEQPIHAFRQCSHSSKTTKGKNVFLQRLAARAWQIVSINAWFHLFSIKNDQPNSMLTHWFQYFKPLSDWLQKTNQANGDVPGWI